MDKRKKPRSTTTPNSQNKEEQAIAQNSTNPAFNNKRKGEIKQI